MPMGFSLLLSFMPLLGIIQTLEDLGFVFKLVVFSYMVFWLYMNLRENPILFGMGVIIASFFTLVQPLPTIILVVIFVIFFTMGYHLQFLIQFGLYPLLRIFGIEMEHPEMIEQQKIHGIEQKLRKGLEISDEEEKFMEDLHKREATYQKKMQERMMRYS
ncbi:MAG: hypothetical protein V1835_06520 [Candidatus Micrarchaeota archaeon]